MGIFGEKKGKLVLVFDVGSSSVGGALFFMQDSGIPKIIFSIRERIILETMFNMDSFLSSTLKSLDIVASKIYKAGLGAPKEIFCVLSSPWYAFQTRIINFEKNTPFVFNSKFANELIQKELELFKKEHLVKYENTEDSLRLIELKNIKTMLNGYNTDKPLNQKAKKLEMTVFISMGPEKVLKKIEETINQNFHSHKKIQFSSFVMASFTAVRDLYVEQEDFILIDIGGEVTDIAMVKKNVLHGSVSFPIGSNFIIRGLASDLNSTLPEAESYLSLFKDVHAAEPTEKKIVEILNKLKNEWLIKLEESLSNISNDISIPATIYIAVDTDLADFFCKIIESEQFNQYALTDSKFKVVLLSAEIFQKIVTFEKEAIRDSNLILGSVYINRFLSSK